MGGRPLGASVPWEAGARAGSDVDHTFKALIGRQRLVNTRFRGKIGPRPAGIAGSTPVVPHRGIGMIDQSGCRCQRCACRIKRVWRRPHCWLTPGTVRDEMQGNWGPDLGELMADHHTRHNPLGQDALFTTPASLMLDARLTPLERNGWQVLRMLRSAEGISPLANLGQLRRYSPLPLGQRGYETARRVLVVLRLTGWISLVGQHRDPLTGHVLSELYQVQESALHFQQACARCQSARASASLHRPRKQPGRSGGRPHSGNARAGT